MFVSQPIDKMLRLWRNEKVKVLVSITFKYTYIFILDRVQDIHLTTLL